MSYITLHELMSDCLLEDSNLLERKTLFFYRIVMSKYENIEHNINRVKRVNLDRPQHAVKKPHSEILIK